MIELNQSWTGPYPIDGETVTWMRVVNGGRGRPSFHIDDEPYPPDVLAACPQAREWGVVFVGPTKSDSEFDWRSSDNKWYWNDKEWYENQVDDSGRYGNRKECLSNPPTKAPPGYVAAKPVPDTLEKLGADAFMDGLRKAVHAKPSLLDELAEVAMKAHEATAVGGDCWHDVALAVARRLLEKEVSKREIEASIAVWRETISTIESMGRIVWASRRAQLAELEGGA